MLSLYYLSSSTIQRFENLMGCPHFLVKKRKQIKQWQHCFKRRPTKDGTQVTLEGLQDDTLDLYDWLSQELFAGITQQFIFCHHLDLVPMWTDIVSWTHIHKHMHKYKYKKKHTRVWQARKHDRYRPLCHHSTIFFYLTCNHTLVFSLRHYY